MTANDSKPYLPYLNKLVDQYNNTYHSINKKTIKKTINVDCSALTENIESNPKATKFKVNDRVRITTYKNIFSKGYVRTFLCKRVVTEYVINELLFRTRQLY